MAAREHGKKIVESSADGTIAVLAQLTAVEAFKWLNELDYNAKFFAEARPLLIQKFGALMWNGRDSGQLPEFLEALQEHAVELISAIRQLQLIVANAGGKDCQPTNNEDFKEVKE